MAPPHHHPSSSRCGGGLLTSPLAAALLLSLAASSSQYASAFRSSPLSTTKTSSSGSRSSRSSSSSSTSAAVAGGGISSRRRPSILKAGGTHRRRQQLHQLRSSDGEEDEAAAQVAEMMQQELEQRKDELDQQAVGAAESEGDDSSRFDVKVDKSGAGFNQFDPVLSATQFVSRRFGLAGGLAIVGLLAATEGREIVASLLAEGPKPGTGEVITTASGLQYEDLLIGPPTGEEPGDGKIVGFNVKVIIGDKVLFDSTNDKPVAFKFGQRPFQNVICAGLEEGLLGMRIGGRRMLTIPADLAPPGVKLPEGVALTYEVTLTEVLNNYF